MSVVAAAEDCYCCRRIEDQSVNKGGKMRKANKRIKSPILLVMDSTALTAITTPAILTLS